MIYFLYGGDSFYALRKINEFKGAYRKKADGFLIEDYDGESEDWDASKFHSVLGQANLFSKVRLIVLRNILKDEEKLFKELESNAEYLRDSKDVFVFWEREPEETASVFFKKYAYKTQAVKKATETELNLFYGNDSIKERDSKSASPFTFIDKMFGPRALIALKEMYIAGIEPQQFIYPFLWKLKQRRMIESYFEGIQIESQMKRVPKNAEEILERFIFSLPDR